MKIFVSWSGELSHKVALALKEWLPNVIQTLDLFVSSEDIDKGTRWFVDVGTELEGSNFGIICVSSENMNAPWILFEAGALSKKINQSRVLPLLIDLSPSDLKGPLVQFQATTISEDDIRKLVNTINRSLEEGQLKDLQINKAFEKWWPDLEQSINLAIKTTRSSAEEEVKRSEREILEEVLDTVRSTARSLTTSDEANAAGSLNIFVAKVKNGLEIMRKPFLSVALEEARRVYVSGDSLNIEFLPSHKFLRDTLLKPDNVQLLRSVCNIVSGRSMGLRVFVNEKANGENDNFLREKE